MSDLVEFPLSRDMVVAAVRLEVRDEGTEDLFERREDILSSLSRASCVRGMILFGSVGATVFWVSMS